MFASTEKKILKLPLEVDQLEILRKILAVHHKLKKIAKYESTVQSSKHVQFLMPQEIRKIKELEKKLSMYLVDVDSTSVLNEYKLGLLNRINVILESYLKLLTQNNNDFNDFFEE